MGDPHDERTQSSEHANYDGADDVDDADSAPNDDTGSESSEDGDRHPSDESDSDAALVVEEQPDEDDMKDSSTPIESATAHEAAITENAEPRMTEFEIPLDGNIATTRPTLSTVASNISSGRAGMEGRGREVNGQNSAAEHNMGG